jgi:hypothetical protein
MGDVLSPEAVHAALNRPARTTTVAALRETDHGRGTPASAKLATASPALLAEPDASPLSADASGEPRTGSRSNIANAARELLSPVPLVDVAKHQADGNELRTASSATRRDKEPHGSVTESLARALIASERRVAKLQTGRKSSVLVTVARTCVAPLNVFAGTMVKFLSALSWHDWAVGLLAARALGPSAAVLAARMLTHARQHLLAWLRDVLRARASELADWLSRQLAGNLLQPLLLRLRRDSGASDGDVGNGGTSAVGVDSCQLQH